MPYIITTIPAGLLHAESDLSRADMPRRAVATLDEARDEAVRIVSEHVPAPSSPPYGDRWDDALLALDAMGGTVGPLPDGTTIEVERVSEPVLREQVRPILRERGPGYDPDDALTLPLAAIIDAFNAAQEG